MATLFLCIVFSLYLLATIGLLVYGLNCYVMLALFAKKRKQANNARTSMQQRTGNLSDNDSLPVVTTQIAIFNEYNVVERIMRAACEMTYPAGKHEIQVLDDSTDNTPELVHRVAQELREEGHDIHVLHRDNRKGYKAGALQEGLEQARGELIGVFDADFVPPKDFLLSVVPSFLEDKTLGFTQARWGHLNRRRSLLTRAQSIGIDGHFVVEQIARCWNSLYMNFNGTAGVWRRAAIKEAGGWQWDTLTEDLDLSYRVQFAGWKTMYLPDVIVPAELPEDVNAFRGQQFRWAKGSFQTLLKLYPKVWRSQESIFKKFQALLHMGGYLVHPLMLTLSILALPILGMTAKMPSMPILYSLLSVPLCFSIIAPSTMYFVSQRVSYKNWLRRIVLLPFLIVVGVGLALSNTKAIYEAITGKETPFIRTPKRGDNEVVQYRIRLPWLAVLEILLGTYSAVSLSFYVSSGKYLASPFLAIYAAGFLFIGLLTVFHSVGLDQKLTLGSYTEPKR